MLEGLNLRLFAVVAMVGVMIIYFGAHDTYLAVHDGTQLQISCADYVAKRPDAKWLRLTGCEYDLDHYAVKYDSHDSSKIKRVYLSVRPVGVKAGPTQILVERSDDDMLRVIAWAEGGSGHAPPQPAFSRIQAQLEQPIEGLVKFGIDLERSEKSDLAKLDLDVAPDFVIVDNGATPSLLRGIIILAVGVLVAGGCTFLFIRELRIQRTAPPAGPTWGRPPARPARSGLALPSWWHRPLFRRRRRR